MAKFKVWATIQNQYEAKVTAESREQALEIAEKMFYENEGFEEVQSINEPQPEFDIEQED